MLTQEEALRLFRYDPETGKLYWKVSPGYSIPPGSLAGTVKGNGYCSMLIAGRRHYAHRIVWVMFNGAFTAPARIDHINGDRNDNKLSNLRVATGSQNQANRKLNKNNTSGFKGVNWSIKLRKWGAQVYIDGKARHLGFFSDILKAARAYDDAALLAFGPFAKTNAMLGLL